MSNTMDNIDNTNTIQEPELIFIDLTNNSYKKFMKKSNHADCSVSEIKNIFSENNFNRLVSLIKTKMSDSQNEVQISSLDYEKISDKIVKDVMSYCDNKENSYSSAS
jgi:hypothetical protein